MKQRKVIVSAIINLSLFGFLVTLVVLGQKNMGPVIWLADILGTKNIRSVSVGVMVVAVFGLLGQLNAYNHKYRS